MVTRVLYVEGNTDGTVGGSYYLLLDLVRNLDRSRFQPLVVFRRSNFLEDSFRECGAEVLVWPKEEAFSFGHVALDRCLAPAKKGINLYRRMLRPAFDHADFIRRERVGLVNLNNSITRNHAWMIGARLAGVPCVTHEMGINDSYSGTSRFLGRRLDAIICLSRAIRDTMVSRGVSPDNTCVIHCGIDLARYRHVDSPEELRVRHGIPPGAPVIGVVGNIREWKGQETIVRAMGMLKQRHHGIRCVLVGGSTEGDLPYRRRLEATCAELGIKDDVIFAGFQRNPIDYMLLMDVVCHTSTSPEPFGIVTLEAMSIGKPLISTTIGGPAEVVENGTSGLLVEPGRPDLLADAVSRLLSDRQLAASMGARGRERLIDKFSLAHNVAETMAVYERVICKSDRNPG